MSIAWAIAIVWIAAIGGTLVMWKIAPENKWYPPYVLGVAIIFAWFVLTYAA